MTSEHSLIAVDSVKTMFPVDVSGCAPSLVDDGLDTILDGREAGSRIITDVAKYRDLAANGTDWQQKRRKVKI